MESKGFIQGLDCIYYEKNLRNQCKAVVFASGAGLMSSELGSGKEDILK